MSLLSICLVLISASIHVGWNYLTKISQNQKAFSLIKGTMLMTFALSVLVFLPIHTISTRVWFYIVLSGIVHAFYSLSLASAYETGDISYVYPIARSAPAFVPLAAFLIIGEHISFRGGIGIVIVILGMWTIQFREKTTVELRQLLNIFKKHDSFWAFATLGTVVTYTIIDKMGVVAFKEITAIDPWKQGPVYFLLECTLSYILFWSYSRWRLKVRIRPTLKKEWPLALLAAIGTMASYSLILFVMRTENVSYIVTLRQSSVFFAVLVGWFILGESYGLKRLIASIVMLVGFYFVATAG